MGRLFAEHRGGQVIYTCHRCQVYLTNKGELVSSRFQGSSGKAYLFSRAWNIKYGPAENREMMTGLHLVRDVMCKFCDEKLGWMYEMAVVHEQRYKEGKVILEKMLINEIAGIDESTPSCSEPVIEPPEEPMAPHRRIKRMKYRNELLNPPPKKRESRGGDSSSSPSFSAHPQLTSSTA